MHDPIGGFERIRDLYVTYLETAFRIRDEGLTAERRALLERPGTLCTEPLVEPVPRYEAADFALHDLVHDGAEDPRLPGFSAEERRAFVELVLAGLFESESAPDGSPVSRRAKFALYEHQADMLRRGVQEGAPGVVTSGTGSGKTESFLLPVFARIAKEATSWPAPSPDYLSRRWWHDENGEAYEWEKVPGRPSEDEPDASPFRPHREGEHPGRPNAVRALVLYPMNALVEDQLTRIRRALDSGEARAVMDEHFRGNRIFFGRYTSATPVTNYHVHPRPTDDEPNRRNRKLQQLFEACRDFERTQEAARRHDEDSPDAEPTRFLFPSTDGAELVTRWDVQATPPDVLVTNTSMLNAMLVREVEAPVFDLTRQWIESDPNAYFYLVLDELHLQRGSAGTEVAYLLRVLLDRLGLTAPEHRHKLRVLASSASLPIDGDEREASLQYLYDAFGLHGRWTRSGPPPHDYPEGWADAVVPGRTKREAPRSTAPLPPQPFLALLDAYGNPEAQQHAPPAEHEAAWRAAAGTLSVPAEGSLREAVVEAVAEAGARIADACWSEAEGRSRATTLSDLAERLFGGRDERARRAVRGVLVVRGLGDVAPSWWGERAGEARERLGTVASFRLHTFFRAIEGLFAAPDEAEWVPEEFRTPERSVGSLTVERGVRFSKRPDGSRGNRIVELLYCECCGDLFYGGRRGGDRDRVELLPFEPDIDNLPESARQQLFEDLSHDDYVVFWPSKRKPADKLTGEPETGSWVPATLDPVVGVARRSATSQENGVAGYLFYRKPDEEDRHGRTNHDGGTAVPFACPFCGTNYGLRSPQFRLSPIRSFRAGFGKTTQLLATELFDLLRLGRGDAKLISFSDSRQEAARAALDVESGHHADLRRDLLVTALRATANGGAPSLDELRREMNEAASKLEFARAQELKERIEAVEQSDRDDAIPLSRVAESLDVKDYFGSYSSRKPLRPFVASFVRLGLHPTDDSGTRPVTIPVGERKKSYHWAQLFDANGDGVDWRDDPVDQPQLDRARDALVEQAQRLLSDALFSRNYFALEETGVGYPCLLGLASSERGELDAFLRVFTDAYRLRDDPWADRGGVQKDPPKPWTSAGDVNARNRVRRFAERLWSADEVDRQLDRVLRRLAATGHPSGLVTTSKLGVRLVDEDAPYWRCGNCGRVHLHRGAGICTRCFQPLPSDAAGQAHELRRRHYVSKRIERDVPPFRLRCEELTGQTHDPADRQRRFRGVVLSDVESGAELPSDVPDPLRRWASVVDLLTVTTTMEVGVDVGSLQATVQANMPPQRFNYQQRVGRAGRRRQAFSMVLTVCRNKSHDLYYFWHPEAITGDAPPPPFLSKSLPDPALRFARKVWLWRAFDLVRAGCARAGEAYPGDELVPPDVHGEFVPTDVFFDPDGPWRTRLADALRASEPFKDRVLEVLTVNSPLVGKLQLTTDELLRELDSATQLEATSPGLGQTLAEAGLLPMLGMPTRVRDLYYHYEVDASGWQPHVEWKTVDRDLDVAIFEFAPGSILVNDKKQLVCVGFTGSLPDKPSWVPSPETGKKRPLLVPREAALGRPFWLVACDYCNGWQRLNEEPDPAKPLECETCGHLLDQGGAAECRVPAGFRTDLRPHPYDPGLRAPRRSGFGITAEGHPIPFNQGGPENLLSGYLQRARTYRLNAGDGNRGYSVGQYRDGRSGPFVRGRRLPIAHQVFAGDQEVLRERHEAENEPGALWAEAVRLAAPKTTDALFLAPRRFNPHLDLLPRTREGRVNTAARAAALSAAFVLTYRAAQELDVDPDELEVVEPRVLRLDADGSLVPSLQITDRLVNGAGYCRQLSELNRGTPRVVRLVDSILHDEGAAPLKDFLRRDEEIDHPKVCDQACYRCLQRYGNQPYHGLLDWRLGLAYLAALYDPAYACGLDGFSGDPAVADWPELAKRYAEDLVRFDGRGSVRSMGELTAFQLTPGTPWTLVVHPLWSVSNPPQLVLDALDKLERAGERVAPPADTFELARNALAVRARIVRRGP